MAFLLAALPAIARPSPDAPAQFAVAPATLPAAAQRNDYQTFRDVFEQASRNAPLNRAWQELERIWTWSLTNRGGAFFGRPMYERLSDEWPAFSAYIEEHKIVDARGATFYPAAETRRFLLEVALAMDARALQPLTPPAPNVPRDATPSTPVPERATVPPPTSQTTAPTEPVVAPATAPEPPPMEPEPVETLPPVKTPEPEVAPPVQTPEPQFTPTQPQPEVVPPAGTVTPPPATSPVLPPEAPASQATPANTGVPPASGTPYVQRGDEELLLLAVRLGDQTLSEDFPAYAVGDRVLVPIGQLAALLSLAITTDVARGVAEGFIIDENRSFALDARAGKVVVKGIERALPEGSTEVHQEDVYATTSLIQEWWPVDLSINLNASLLRVVPREPLPSERRRQREAWAQRSLGMRGAQRAGYPEREHPYALFGLPFLAPTISVGWREGDKPTTGIAGFASADLLYTEANIYFSFLDGKRQDFRGAAGRRDPDAGLLGPLRAREFSIGDVYSPGSDLLTTGGLGRGFVVSNYPLIRQDQFDRHTFRGDLPIGWEVELYQNNALLAYQQSRPDGLYEFTDVPLMFGQNIFRLVFYGPEGQTRDEVVRFNVDETLTPPGETHYRISKFDDNQFADRWLGQVEHGLNRNLSITAAAAMLGYQDSDEQYGKVGANMRFSRFSGRFESAFDRDGGHAELFGIHTRVGPVDVSASHARASEFRSDYFQSLFAEQSLEERTIARADIQLPLGETMTLPLSFEARREAFTSGRISTELLNRVSGQWQRTFLTHELRARHVETAGGPNDMSRVHGRLLASRRFKDLAARGELAYDASARDLESIEGSVEKRLGRLYFAQAGIRRNVLAGSTRFFATLNKSEGRYGLRLSTEYEESRGFSIATLVSFATFFEQEGSRWYFDARSVASQGSASVFVYIDANNNRAFDEGERPVEGLGFFIDQRSAPEVTDASGRALLLALPTGAKVEVSPAIASLETGTYKADPAGYTILPRSGSAVELEFPLVETVEAVGTVWMRDVADRRPAGGIELELTDASGAVAAKTTTSYDGFFEFVSVTPGRYSLRVAPAQATSLGVVAIHAVELDLSVGGTIREGVELELRKIEPAVSERVVSDGSR